MAKSDGKGKRRYEPERNNATLTNNVRLAHAEYKKSGRRTVGHDPASKATNDARKVYIKRA